METIIRLKNESKGYSSSFIKLGSMSSGNNMTLINWIAKTIIPVVLPKTAIKRRMVGQCMLASYDIYHSI